MSIQRLSNKTTREWELVCRLGYRNASLRWLVQFFWCGLPCQQLRQPWLSFLRTLWRQHVYLGAFTAATRRRKQALHSCFCTHIFYRCLWWCSSTLELSTLSKARYRSELCRLCLRNVVLCNWLPLCEHSTGFQSYFIAEKMCNLVQSGKYVLRILNTFYEHCWVCGIVCCFLLLSEWLWNWIAPA